MTFVFCNDRAVSCFIFDIAVSCRYFQPVANIKALDLSFALHGAILIVAYRHIGAQ